MLIREYLLIGFYVFILYLTKNNEAVDIVFPGEDIPGIETKLLEAGNPNIRNRQIPPSGLCNLSNGREGKCLRLRECPILLNLLRRDRSRETYDFLRRGICRLEIREVFTCCPTTEPFAPLDTNPLIDPWQAPVRSSLVTSEDDCGYTTTQRIIGGEMAEPGEFPWLVSIGMPEGIGFKPICGGTLITKRHVITAAHCFIPRVLPFTTHVRLGDYSLSKNDDNGTPISLKIKERRGLNYNEFTLKEDIMILTLERDVEFGDYIRPLCLPFHLENEEFENINITVVGWGDTVYGSQAGSDIPFKALLTTVTKEECRRKYAKAAGSPALDSTQICAGTGIKDTCQGDSGGPMIYTDVNKARYFLIGIVSYGIECANQAFPGVYTRVTSYLPWITSNLK